MAKPKRVVDVEIMVTVSEADGNAAIRSLQHWFDVSYIGMRVKKPARASKPRRPTKVEQPLTE